MSGLASCIDRREIRALEPAPYAPHASFRRTRALIAAPDIFLTTPDASLPGRTRARYILPIEPPHSPVPASPFPSFHHPRFRRHRHGPERDVRRRQDRRGTHGPLHLQRAVKPEHPGVHEAPPPGPSVPSQRALHGRPRSARSGGSKRTRRAGPGAVRVLRRGLGSPVLPGHVADERVPQRRQPGADASTDS